MPNLRVFPLPGVVLMPGANLPLHVFELRYRAMVADAVAGDGLICVAQIVEGQESAQLGAPEVYPYAGVGRIVSHEGLPDGRSNIVLAPAGRVRLGRERGSTAAWRSFEAEVLPEVNAADPRLALVGERLLGLVAPIFRRFGARGEVLAKSLATLPVASVPAALAPLLGRESAARQEYLAEDDAYRRAELVEAALFAVFAESRVNQAAEA